MSPGHLCIAIRSPRICSDSLVELRSYTATKVSSFISDFARHAATPSALCSADLVRFCVQSIATPCYRTYACRRLELWGMQLQTFLLQTTRSKQRMTSSMRSWYICTLDLKARPHDMQLELAHCAAGRAIEGAALMSLCMLDLKPSCIVFCLFNAAFC